MRCGQQIVNDRVKTIIFGFVTVPNQSIYATVKGTNPITGVITSSPARPDGEERLLPERQPDERDRRLSARTRGGSTADGEDRDRRLSRLARRHHGRGRGQEGLRQVGREVTIIAIPPLATDLIGPATQASPV